MRPLPHCFFLLPALLIAAARCGGDGGGGTGPSPATIAGTYDATTFTVLSGATTVDLLAAGGSLMVTLTAGGTASGTLVVPDTQLGPGFTASMAGTFVVTGSTVRFTQGADTFVRDLTWTIVGNTLTTSGPAGGGATVTVTLTRRPG